MKKFSFILLLLMSFLSAHVEAGQGTLNGISWNFGGGTQWQTPQEAAEAYIQNSPCGTTTLKAALRYAYESSTVVRVSQVAYVCNGNNIGAQSNFGAANRVGACVTGTTYNSSTFTCGAALTIPATFEWGNTAAPGQAYSSPLAACQASFFAPYNSTAAVSLKPDGSAYTCTATANGQTVTNPDIAAAPRLSCALGYRQSLTNINECISGTVAPDTQTPGVVPITCPTGYTVDQANQRCIAPSPTPTPTGAPGTCPVNTVNIGTRADGTPLCAPTLSSQPTPAQTRTETVAPPAVVNNGDGSTTTTEVSTRSNSDGSTTTTTTTTNVAANGHTTITVGQSTGNNSGGIAGRSDGSGEGDDFCALHPELNICKNSSITGSCSATACDGDAITCEIARQTRKANCDHQKEIDDIKAHSSYSLGNNLLSGADPLSSTLPKPDNPTTVNMSTALSQASFLSSSGSCLSDVPFTANGAAFSLPFSSVCEHLLPLRYAMLIIGGLIAFRIVRTSVLS